MKLKRLIAVATLAITSVAMADIKPAGLFTDNMVIQRETQAPVWGWGDMGEKVTVTGSWGESAKTTVGADGKWKLKLQTPVAGGPHTITIKGRNTVVLKNVLSGDVWLCSGQSNMQWSVAQADNPAEEAAQANYPQIRHFKVALIPAREEAADCKGAWTVCSPATVKHYSAVAYFTGRELHQNLDVPIGLLTSAWGGTCVEAWTPLAEQMDDPFALERKTEIDKRAAIYSPEKARVNFDQQMETWEARVAAAKAQNKRSPRKPRLQTDPGLSHNYPGNLYNGMIHPLRPFAIKGAVWYQGESNAKTQASAEHYRVQLDRMIRSWRSTWEEDFPFYAVQLPDFKKAQVHPVEADNIWPVIRESFVHVAQNTPGVATSAMLGLGSAGNIHPKNKQDVGRRMASTILNKTYGKETPTTPFMKSFAVEGDQVVVQFDYTGSGLMARGGPLKSFAVAGADKKFVPADAVIETRDGADCVVVRAAGLTEPVAVRYAWADNPAESNLYSKEGFPASPFRTDSWEFPKQAPAVAASPKAQPTRARAPKALGQDRDTRRAKRAQQQNNRQKVRTKKAEKPAPTYADVAYDVHERTVLDFYQAEGEGPRPVRVFIHGGGWIQGDKSRISDVKAHLEKGISVAAVNYRYSGTDPLPVPVHDAVRAIQFLRHKAGEWNIDKERFVLTGGSAGGCSSLLIACFDDFANPDSDDPVERESSRVQGAAVRGAQTAIDPKLIEPWIGTNVYHSMIYKAVGEDSIEEALANYAKHEATYKEFSAYNHLSPDDPPLSLGYNPSLIVPAVSLGHGIHHGLFGVKFKERSEAVGHNQVHLFIKGKHESKEFANDEEFITHILLGK